VEFGEFVRRRSPDLLRTGWLLTGDWGRAEDLVQTALLHCWPKWESVASPEAYVRSAMVNAYVSWRRRRAAGELAVARVPESVAPDQVGGADLRDGIRSALATLGRRERAVVVLRYYLDLSEAETAANLGVAVGTVKRYLADALTKLRAEPGLRGLLTEEISG
jgi:RNA polymerase sigma-70 factor (sigma-E family)